MIIGLSGKKGAGKNEVANAIRLINPNIWEQSFARILKSMTASLVGCHITKLEDREFKETPIPRLGGKSPREMMQLLGTEFGREMIDQDVWVNATLSQYHEISGVDWVITDVRFPNEAAGIKAKGGFVIRVERPGLPQTDLHPSETALDDYPFDWTIHNDLDIPHLHQVTKTVYQEILRRVKE